MGLTWGVDISNVECVVWWIMGMGMMRRVDIGNGVSGYQG